MNPTNPALPQSWGQGGWGTNARAFAYPTGGARSGSRFTRVTVTSYTSGDAKWFFPHVNVAPNTSYTFSDWYRSGVTTQLVAEFRSSSGAVSYSVPVNVPPSSNWSPSTWVFSTPASTTSVTIYHLIGSVGTLDTDDTSLSLTTGVPPPPPPPPTTTPPTTTPPTTVPPTTVPPGNRPIVYLTFDDGPGPDYTPAMIDMLGRYGVRATFFILGQNVRSFPSVTAQVIQRGHAIGNHTDTHPDLTTLTSAQIASQLTTSGDSIFAAAGVRPKCMRPPYGRLNATATSTIASLGLSTIMWTHDTRDWDTAVTSVGSIVNTLNTVSNGSIVLMHDFAPNTIIAVDQWLAANVSRFEFRTIPSC